MKVSIGSRIRCVFAALLGASVFAFSATAGAATPSLLILPVEAEPADAAAAHELDAALLAAFGEGERFEAVSGVPLVGERGAEGFRQAAEQAGVDALVAAVLDNGSVALELRSAHSGGVITGWTLDASELALSSVVREMQLILAAQQPRSVDEPPVGATGATPSDEESVLAGARGDGPIAIRSDQLDVATKDGQRHLVFRRNVVVEQGDIELHSEKLDAFYAEGDSQPERLVAHGDVEIFQGDRVAYCDVATYLRSDQRVVCRGHARLVQGCDVVRGDRLEFDLEREHFRVVGAASVVLAEDGASCTPSDREAGS